MKKFYFKFRIGLMTFTLGLASVFAFNGLLKYSDEIPVKLPKVENGEVLVVFPRYGSEMPHGGGEAGGSQIQIGCITTNRKKICR
jgi:hypothetical protein